MKKERIEYSSQAQSFKCGIYQHYKGQFYRALYIARVESTLEEVVVYEMLYDDFSIWTRPLHKFLEEIEHNGQKMQRFTFIKTI